MTLRHLPIIWLLLILCFTNIALAQPSFQSSLLIEEQAIFKDAKNPNLYYYKPLDYTLATNAEGKPDFSMIQMRYTGTQATGDAGKQKFNNLLQFKIVLDLPQQKKINRIKTILLKNNPTAQLQLLPIKKFSSVLVFASINADTAAKDSMKLLSTSDEVTDVNATSNNSYWTERLITLRLSNADAEIIEAALKNHQSVMSFSYAFFSAFSEVNNTDLQVYGNSATKQRVKKYFEETVLPQKDTALHTTLIKANTINLSVDINQWPNTIQKVDINEKLPAKYALFDVYCYDFNNELRADLYAKKIEIKVTSINGSEVAVSFAFKQSRPDIYTKSIRFPYAVKFNKPFQYRITEMGVDGEITTTEWKQKKEWSEIIDITSSSEKIIHATKITDQ
jgi:hypothetical protein